MAMASPWPRAMATSRRVGRRGRLASRALSEVNSGRSAEKLTSSSGLPATARTAAPMAVLNAWVVSGLFALLRGGFAIALSPRRGWRRPPHPALRADLSPEGEVGCGTMLPNRHLSLGGEV